MQRRSLGRSLALVVSAALLGTLAIAQHPEPAHAAARQSVSAKATVGADRRVSVTVKCQSKTTCTGKLKLSLTTGGKKTLSYRVAKRSSKTLVWTLSSSAYKKFLKKGKGKLKISGTAKRPAKAKFSRSVTLKSAKPQLAVSKKSFQVATDRKLSLPLTCRAAKGCTATVQLDIAGVKSAKTTIKSKAKGKQTARFELAWFLFRPGFLSAGR